MKKYILFLFILVFILLGFSVDSANAMGVNPGCMAGDIFSRTTGQACRDTAVVTCPAGDLFSSVTGQPCTGVNLGSGSLGGNSQDNSSIVAQFNNLLKQNGREGNKIGGHVKILQQLLKDQGYYSGKVDGKYGRITARAVSDFQSDNNISTNPQTPSISNFSCNPTNVPLDVICGAYGLSVNSTYSIDFGDGSNSGPLTLIPPAHAFGADGPNNKMIATSLYENPRHTYTYPGNYAISFYKDSTKISSVNITAVSPITSMQTYSNSQYGFSF